MHEEICMKKIARLLLILLAIAFLLTGCKAPEETVEPEIIDTQPTQTPKKKSAEAAPTIVWEPDPTITPITFEGDLLTPKPSEDPPLIHPIDRQKFDFTDTEYVEPKEPTDLGVGFNVPKNWLPFIDPNLPTTITYMEPPDNIQSGTGIPSTVMVSISSTASEATEKDAQDLIDESLRLLEEQYPNSLEYSKPAMQRMNELRKEGPYVTFWIELVPDGQNKSVRVRGRIHVVPKDRKLVLIRYYCPADYNVDYSEVYVKVRETIRLLD